jgi:serine/threonine protein phosphatase PrpC
LYPEDIARIASQNKDAENIARDLVKFAVEVDGSDNATAQVIQVRSIEPMGMYRGRLYPRPIQP